MFDQAGIHAARGNNKWSIKNWKIFIPCRIFRIYAVEKKFKTIPQGEGEGWVTDTKDLLATPLYQLLLKMIFQDTDIQ